MSLDQKVIYIIKAVACAINILQWLMTLLQLSVSDATIWRVTLNYDHDTLIHDVYSTVITHDNSQPIDYHNIFIVQATALSL